MKTQTHSSEFLGTALFFTVSKKIRQKTAAAFLADLTLEPNSYAELLAAWKNKYSAVPLPDERYWDEAEKLIEMHTAKNIYLIDYRSSTYPASLRLLDDPPSVLFLRGEPESIHMTPGVAIVGTRTSTHAGRTIACRIASHLAAQGWPIVSGLALGIDRAAHEGALLAGGVSIAVLAHGLHTASPRSNAKLADQILELRGSWVSEYPLGVPPQKAFFLARNRIQIGLSSGSIIVEAEVNSGSMAQARLCVGAKRPLFAVIPTDSANDLKLNCLGTLQMVNHMGAFPIKSRMDYDKMESKLNASKKLLMNLVAKSCA